MRLLATLIVCYHVAQSMAFHRLVGSWKLSIKTPPHDPTFHLDESGKLRCVTLDNITITGRVQADTFNDDIIVIDRIGATRLPPIRSVTWRDVSMYLAIRATAPFTIMVIHDKDRDRATAIWKFRNQSHKVDLVRLHT